MPVRRVGISQGGVSALAGLSFGVYKGSNFKVTRRLVPRFSDGFAVEIFFRWIFSAF